LDDLERGFAFKAAISMVFIMEELEVLGLRSEVAVAPKPLSSEESLIVRIIEALNDSITPRFSNGNENHFDPQQQTESEDSAKRARIAIAPAEAKFVVELKKVGKAHRPPTADQAQSHGLIVFSALGMEEDSVTVEIHNIE